MNVRIVTGFVAGCVIWWFLFLAAGIGFGLLWPAYREAAHVLFSAGDSSYFTTPIYFLNFLVFSIAGIVVGWLVSLFSKNRMTALVVALLYLFFMSFNHYYLEWDNFPAWYNVIVPFIISGSIALGSRFSRAV